MELKYLTILEGKGIHEKIPPKKMRKNLRTGRMFLSSQINKVILKIIELHIEIKEANDDRGIYKAIAKFLIAEMINAGPPLLCVS